MLLIRRVRGHSMRPTLPDGSVVVFRRAKPQANSIVLAEVDGLQVVKRIQSFKGSQLTLAGDNQQSSVYRVTPQAIKGKLLFCLKAAKVVK